MWKCGTRECAHIAVSNFSFPYVLSHSQPLLSLFNFPRNSSAAPSAALVLFVPVPSACVTLIYSATQTAPSLARRTRSSFALLSKTLVQCPARGAPDVSLPCDSAKRPQMSRSRSLWVQLFPHRKETGANSTFLSPSPCSGQSPPYPAGVRAVLCSATSKTSLLLQNMLQHI